MGCSPRTRREQKGRGSIASSFGLTASLPPVALFGPRVAAHVIAVLLPETGLVAVHELEPAHPLGALPEVQVGHEQTQRPTVFRADRLAIAHVDEHVLVAQKIVETQV